MDLLVLRTDYKICTERKVGVTKISKHLMYSKGYGSTAQTILSVPIQPPREFVKRCVPTVGYLSSKLYTGVGNLSFMNLLFSSTFS